MNNKKTIYFIISISIFVGVLHILIGPNYQGFGNGFISGYLIDILLPLNVYLLFQVVLRKVISILFSRIYGAVFTFSIGLIVEFLQYAGFDVFGNTYDPLDILMYGSGVLLGLLIDLLIISKLEKRC